MSAHFHIPDEHHYGRAFTGWDVAEFTWVCDCKKYDLEPRPDTIGECATCRRPVYGADGQRVCS